MSNTPDEARVVQAILVDGKLDKLVLEQEDHSVVRVPIPGFGIGDEIVCSISGYSLAGEFTNPLLPWVVVSNDEASFAFDNATKKVSAVVDLVAVLELSVFYPGGTAGNTRFGSMTFDSGEAIYKNAVKPIDDDVYYRFSVTRKIAAGDSIIVGAVHGEASPLNIDATFRAFRLG